MKTFDFIVYILLYFMRTKSLSEVGMQKLGQPQCKKQS